MMKDVESSALSSSPPASPAAFSGRRRHGRRLAMVEASPSVTSMNDVLPPEVSTRFERGLLR